MVVSKNRNQSDLKSLTWDQKLSLNEKLGILKSYFNCPLDQVPFWKLYRTVKTFNS
ncbi:MAG: hypothetical protein ACTSO9_02605 [Candidatus Helarchaeota archaeon]